MQTMFEAHYQPLTNPSWGEVSILPWDTEIFDFPVADYRPGDLSSVARKQTLFREHFNNWTSNHKIELVSCYLSEDNLRWSFLLTRLGFIPVDNTLQATLPRVQTANLPATRISLRLAEPGDRAEVERIAETSFRFGRYHADPRFPKSLANLRYRCWADNALSAPTLENRVYVIGQPPKVIGFFHVVLRDNLADLRLGAVDAMAELGIAGFSLYTGTLQALKQAGARQATARISTSNTAVMNIYSALGFRFSRPETVFHWHAPDACHLIDPYEIR